MPSKKAKTVKNAAPKKTASPSSKRKAPTKRTASPAAGRKPIKKKITARKTKAKTNPQHAPAEGDSREARKHRSYEKAKTNAAEFAKDPKKLKDLIGRAKKIADNKAKGPLAKIWDDLQTVFRMLRAYANGSYREAPYLSLTMLIASIAYLLSPIDLIPDALVGIGLIDDAAILAWTFQQVRADINAFREWEEAD